MLSLTSQRRWRFAKVLFVEVVGWTACGGPAHNFHGSRPAACGGPAYGFHENRAADAGGPAYGFHSNYC